MMSNSAKNVIFAVLFVGLSTAGPGRAESKPDDDLFDQASPAIRAYAKLAREADAIPDRMERCVKFPDIPGNRWKKDLVYQACENLFGKFISPGPDYRSARPERSC